jgi:hypothetical protein
MTQTNTNIHYQPMSLERHDPREVAALIYQAAPDLFALMFGPPAIQCLMALVERSHLSPKTHPSRERSITGSN